MTTKRFTHIELHPRSDRAHPQLTRMLCEAPGCDNEFVMADAYSVITTMWALTGDEVRFSTQCPEEQHYACSPACARAALIACFDEHLAPLHAAVLAEHRAAQAAATMYATQIPAPAPAETPKPARQRTSRKKATA